MIDPQPPSATKLISLDVVLWLGLSTLCFWLWYESYLGVEFNELGRHFDADQHVVFTDSAFVWGLPALGFLLVAAIRVASRIRRRRRLGLREGQGPSRLPDGP